MNNVLISPRDITWQSHRLPGAAETWVVLEVAAAHRMALEVSSSAGWWQAPPGQPHGAMLPRLSFLGKLCTCHRQTGRGAPVTCRWPGCPCPSAATCQLARLSSARAALFPTGKTVRGLCCACASSQSSLGFGF